MNLEFEFVNHANEVAWNLSEAVGMVAYFDCLNCGFMLRFAKKYEPVPLHYESLLRKCKPVTCPKCGSVHYHIDDDEGGDAVALSELPFFDPNQLRLFA